jgi:hypothetical protein
MFVILTCSKIVAGKYLLLSKFLRRRGAFLNFETKYFIRWGVPGWIFIVTIGIYMYLLDYKDRKLLNDVISNGPELLATAALLIIIGIPVGYVLNQIHHVWIWVIRVNKVKYFKMELKRSTELRERYTYLLNRVHELGGIVVALIPSFIFLLVYHKLMNLQFNFPFVLYFIILGVVSLVMLCSRDYYRSNLDAFTQAISGLEYKDVINGLFIRLRKLRKMVMFWR